MTSSASNYESPLLTRRYEQREEHRGTCFAIGNSYAQVLHAHLLYPVSADMTRRFAHVGQNSILSDKVLERAGVDRENLNGSSTGKKAAPPAQMDSPITRDTAVGDALKPSTFQVYARILGRHSGH